MRYGDIDFNNKIVLITGGAGFIGSNLAFYFQENFPKCKVVIFDKFRTDETFSNGNLKSFGHFKNLLGFKGIVISGDITDKEDLKKLQDYKFDFIFHEAAISDTTVSDQKVMIDTNVNAFVDLLDIAKNAGAAMVYASSAATYGDSKIFSIGHEQPNNVYGFSKFLMDNIAKEYMKKSDISIVGLRYFNVYGEREYFKNKTASMVLQFGLQLLRGESAKLFQGSDKIKRDFIYIEDVVTANLMVLKKGVSGIFNIGSGIETSIISLLREISDILNIRNLEYIRKPPRKGDVRRSMADISKAYKNFGWKPNISLKEGLEATIKWFLERKNI